MSTPAGARRHGTLDRLVELLAWIAGAALCALTILICVDVASRSLKLFAMPWSLDVAEYLLYAITFLGAPWVLRDGGHISVDLLVQHLTPAPRRVLARVAAAVGALVCLILLYYSVRVWHASYRDGTMVYETFIFPEWILFAGAPPVFLLLAFVFARDVIRPKPKDPSRAP